MAYQFIVDDDSPEIAYFPFMNIDPTTSNFTAGWQLLYTISGAALVPGQVGVGTSYHYTSLDGASLMINWNGTGIDLAGSVSNALYNISLDGMPSTSYLADPTNAILASFDDLENTNHSLLLTTIITNTTSPDTFLTFDQATITYAPPAGIPNTTATSQAISNSDIAFVGMWDYVSDDTGNSMHVSNSAGDTAEITFLGSAITVYGLTSSYSGKFTVTLDNITTDLSARSSYNDSDTLLFYATDLSQDIAHHMVVINQENRTLALREGGMNTTCFGNDTTRPTSLSSGNSLSAGTIAAIVLSVVLFIVIMGILYYAFCIRRKAPAINQRASQARRKPLDNKANADIEQVTSTLESTSLSTTKGYGFGLGLRRGFPFASRKNKMGSSSSGRSRKWTTSQAEFHPMTPQRDRNEKRLSIFTLTEDLPVLLDAPESEKLAPGWCNPVARAPPSFKYTRYWKETHGISLSELGLEPIEPVEDDGDDADVKTLTSRQDEAIAAMLSLSPRTSEALSPMEVTAVPRPAINTQDRTKHSDENRQPELLQVRNTSPFAIDVSAILGTRKGNRDSRASGSSTWSKVRAKLYRKAHQDDGRQSSCTDRQDMSSSSGPESVPVVMHESGSANSPSEAVSSPRTYSFLDLASSHVSLRRQSKTTTLSSTPADLGHSSKDISAWNENTSMRMVRIEHLRDDILAPKPDAPSTASDGSHPSDRSATHAVPSTPIIHTQMSPVFPFTITIPSSPRIAHPLDHVPERHITPSPPPSQSDQHLQIPRIASPELPVTPANSPTESVPFSVSDIHFRHSFSDQAGFDSQRASVTSVLPPHPPLPHRDSPHASTSTYSPPPPYIVQRVLGLPLSPLSPLSALSSTALPPMTPNSPTPTPLSVRRPGTAPTQSASSFRVGSLLGPRPRPMTAGLIRGSAAPQLPMQGGRGNLRGA